MTIDHFAEQSLESAMIIIVFIDRLPLIAPADDMVKRTRSVHGVFAPRAHLA
jgi:hypothetical protein